MDVQATRRVLLENCKLVAKREDLRLQGSTGSKTGGHQSEKGNEKRAHRGSQHDLTNDWNVCVFTSDGVFGIHTTESLPRDWACTDVGDRRRDIENKVKRLKRLLKRLGEAEIENRKEEK